MSLRLNKAWPSIIILNRFDKIWIKKFWLIVIFKKHVTETVPATRPIFLIAKYFYLWKIITLYIYWNFSSEINLVWLKMYRMSLLLLTTTAVVEWLYICSILWNSAGSKSTQYWGNSGTRKRVLNKALLHFKKVEETGIRDMLFRLILGIYPSLYYTMYTCPCHIFKPPKSFSDAISAFSKSDQMLYYP